ncbi:unnamed protein product [Rotaria sp. Silwood1]|nr:unnamed protein product [Rotaria sp. Silwood1]
MPVLYGVFMFMGVSALRHMQIFDRILLFFMPPKYQPDYPYLRHVRITRVHLFTIIQILALIGMFALKSIKSIAIGFPLLVLGTCFVRKLMDKIFTQEELYWLDDILPGTKLDRIRRSSAPRNVYIPEIMEGLNDENEQVTILLLFFSTKFIYLIPIILIIQPPTDASFTLSANEADDSNRDTLENSLSHIVEVSKQQKYGSLSIDHSNQSCIPLIVVDEFISPEETSVNTREEAEQLMHRETSLETYRDGKCKNVQTSV